MREGVKSDEDKDRKETILRALVHADETWPSGLGPTSDMPSNQGSRPRPRGPIMRRLKLMVTQLRNFDRFATRASGEGGQDRGDGVSQKSHRFVGEQPIATAVVKTPEVVAVAGVVEPTRAVGRGERGRTGSVRAGTDHGHLGNVHVLIGPTESTADDRGVIPLAGLQAVRRRPLTDRNRLAGPVRHVGRTDSGYL